MLANNRAAARSADPSLHRLGDRSDRRAGCCREWSMIPQESWQAPAQGSAGPSVEAGHGVFVAVHPGVWVALHGRRSRSYARSSLESGSERLSRRMYSPTFGGSACDCGSSSASRACTRLARGSASFTNPQPFDTVLTNKASRSACLPRAGVLSPRFGCEVS
jgi:hypothetical protein